MNAAVSTYNKLGCASCIYEATHTQNMPCIQCIEKTAPSDAKGYHYVKHRHALHTPPAEHTPVPGLIYMAGSLRNQNITLLACELQTAVDRPVFADWTAAGPEADDHWKAYYQARGFNYRDALKEPASRHVFEFDKKWIDACTSMVLVLPAGKSGHLELGYAIGKGKNGYILLDGNADRWDVMYQFAAGVADNVEELIAMIKAELP